MVIESSYPMYIEGFVSTHQLVHDLRVAASRDIPLIAIAWNRREPEDTEWWLAPAGAESPAYRYGKIAVKHSRGAKDLVFCGYYIERGIVAGPDVEPREAYRLTSQWLWPAFVENLASNISKILVRFEERQDMGPVLIEVSYGPVASPEADWKAQRAAREARQYSRWRWDRGRLHPMMGQQEVTALRSVETLTELKERLDRIPYPETTWVDLYIGHELRTSPDNRAVTPTVLWDEVLSEWLPWIR